MSTLHRLGERMLALRRNGGLTAAKAKPLLDAAEAELVSEAQRKLFRGVVNEMQCLVRLYDDESFPREFRRLAARVSVTEWHSDGSGI